MSKPTRGLFFLSWLSVFSICAGFTSWHTATYFETPDHCVLSRGQPLIYPNTVRLIAREHLNQKLHRNEKKRKTLNPARCGMPWAPPGHDLQQQVRQKKWVSHWLEVGHICPWLMALGQVIMCVCVLSICSRHWINTHFRMSTPRSHSLAQWHFD